MSEHPYREGDRVWMTFNNCGWPERRRGTVVQVSETQPHITWVDWECGPKWQMVGTRHLSRRSAPQNGEEAQTHA